MHRYRKINMLTNTNVIFCKKDHVVTCVFLLFHELSTLLVRDVPSVGVFLS